MGLGSLFSGLSSIVKTAAPIVKTAAPIVEAGTNIYGAISANKASKAAQQQANVALSDMDDVSEQYERLMSLEQEKYADQKALNEYIKQLATEQVAYAKKFGDEQTYQNAMQIYNDVMAGKFPKGLFDAITSEMDVELQSQLANIDRAAKSDQELIATMLPDGGVRTRRLASIALKAADDKATAMKTVAQNRRKELTTAYRELFGKALEAGEGSLDKVYTAMQGQVNALASLTPGETAGQLNALNQLSTSAKDAYTTATGQVDNSGQAAGVFTKNLVTGLGALADAGTKLTETTSTSSPSALVSGDSWARYSGSR